MRRKINNSLVLVSYTNGDKFYFTSMTSAGLRVALAAQSVKWAIEKGNKLKDLQDKEFTISIIDGSEIPYKLINN